MDRERNYDRRHTAIRPGKIPIKAEVKPKIRLLSVTAVILKPVQAFAVALGLRRFSTGTNRNNAELKQLADRLEAHGRTGTTNRLMESCGMSYYMERCSTR